MPTMAATTEIPASTTEPITAPIGLVCPKCGTSKKSGKLSCCIRGGSWYKNCGDPGDSSFDHTWFEGTQACTNFDSSLSGYQAPQVVASVVDRVSNANSMNSKTEIVIFASLFINIILLESMC